jgi:hypothetical protein
MKFDDDPFDPNGLRNSDCAHFKNRTAHLNGLPLCDHLLKAAVSGLSAWMVIGLWGDFSSYVHFL